MIKRAIIALSLSLAASTAVAQSVPGFFVNQRPTPAQWDSYFAGKLDAANGATSTDLTIGGVLIATGGVNSANPTGYKQHGITVLNIIGGTFNGGSFAPACVNNCGVRVGALAGVNLPSFDSLTTAIGYHALASANPTDSRGTESTAVGWNAAGNISGAGPYFLTILGVNAQGACTTECLNNIAIGTDAMRDTMSATEGVAIGQYALGFGSSTLSIGIGNGALKGNPGNTSVSTWNVAIGHQAMFGVNATALTENVAIGPFAMFAATSGTRNVALGMAAGNAITSDTQNVFVGWKAGLLQTGARDNTCVGFFCLSGAITSAGVSNTAIGSYAGVAITAGYGNVLAGFEAGKVITTGCTNTIAGHQVGSTTLTTGCGNILIGTSNAVDTTAAGSIHQINIGNLIFYNKATTAAPAVSLCGTSPAIDARANNRSGTLTAGTGAPVSCTMVFAGGGYQSWSHCRVTSQSPVSGFGYVSTVSGIVISGAAFSGAKFDYDCDGL